MRSGPFGTSEGISAAESLLFDQVGCMWLVVQMVHFVVRQSEEGNDAFIRKYNSDGDEEWEAVWDIRI